MNTTFLTGTVTSQPSLVAIQRESKPRIVSIGYEKRSLEGFLLILREMGVSVLVDVRQSAFSMRPEFRKKRLSAELSEAGIDYAHLSEAGNPFRKDAGSAADCLRLYKEFLEGNPNVVRKVANRLVGLQETYGAIALLCYERHPDDCHRTILIRKILEEDPNYSLIEV